ncbi:MAG TPA: tetratricopeptide repeat protein [Spirochaetota bacterium]|nr:tetratricopeptide repeat protein [Spirochaetota bacterium]
MANSNKMLKDAIFSYNRKNFDEAKVLFSEVIDKDPTNPEANYYLGLMYAKDENHKKAVLHLKNVVDLGTNFLFTTQCRMILGYIYFKNRDFDRAEYEFKSVIDSKLNVVQVYAALAAVYYQNDDKKKALEYAEKAYQMDQFNLNAKNTYAFFLSDFEINVSKSLDIIREVVRVKPNNPAYLDSLGWAYYKKGDIKASLASLKKALEIDRNYQDVVDHYDIVTGKKKITGR